MVSQIYPTVLQLNKATSFNIGVIIVYLDLSITNGIVLSKFYNKKMTLSLNS